MHSDLCDYFPPWTTYLAVLALGIFYWNQTH